MSAQKVKLLTNHIRQKNKHSLLVRAEFFHAKFAHVCGKNQTMKPLTR
jgi:hypothetical protein